jgi:hypothetical protein
MSFNTPNYGKYNLRFLSGMPIYVGVYFTAGLYFGNAIWGLVSSFLSIFIYAAVSWALYKYLLKKFRVNELLLYAALLMVQGAVIYLLTR